MSRPVVIKYWSDLDLAFQVPTSEDLAEFF